MTRMSAQVAWLILCHSILFYFYVTLFLFPSYITYWYVLLVSGAQLNLGRRTWAVRYQSNWLKQQADSKRAKPLITSCDGLSASLKLEKVLTHSVPLSSIESGQVKGRVDLHRCEGRLTVEGVLNKSCWQFYAHWGGIEVRGGERGELGVQKYWILSQNGEKCQVSHLYSPLRRPQQRHLKRASV